MSQIEHLDGVKKYIYNLIYVMIFVSPMLVLQIKGKELFLWMQILFFIVMFIEYKRIYIAKSGWIIFLFAEPFVAGIFASVSTMPDEYKRTAINLAIMSLPLYLTISYFYKMIKDRISVIEIIIKALKLAIITEIIWFFAQLLLYRVIGIDINQILFVDTLHLVDNASFDRSWVWYPSGLSWHSAVLAPLFVLGMLLFDNTIIRGLILLESFLCGNSTTLLGVMLCMILLMIRSMYNGKFEVSKGKLIQIFILAILIIIVFCTPAIMDKLAEVVIRLGTRLFGAEKDASTAAHLGYYSDYIKILKNSSLSQIIFGYGYGCSGYTITELYGRYADGGTWAIECDYVNILVSRGIIGFISYYSFLLYIMLKGIKIDIRYFIFIFVILFQGFGYNIQFDYLLLIEIIMFISIREDINFFDTVDKINNQKVKRGFIKYD